MRQRSRIACLVALALVGAGAEARAQLLSFLDEPTCPERAFAMETLEDGRTRTLVGRRSRGLLEATVQVWAIMSNARSSVPLPFTADLAGDEAVELAVLRAQNTMKTWFFAPRYRWCPGLRGGRHDDDHVYALPYEAGRCWVVGQGALGAFSHGPGTGSEQAIDFVMPKGSLITAARDGVVVHVRQDSDTGGMDRRFESCANYVVVRHADGTYATYVHLSPFSAQVVAGQQVQVGTPIGQSGDSGFTSGPHLHFDVYTPTDAGLRETIGVAFRTSNGVVRELVPGESYCSP